MLKKLSYIFILLNLNYLFAYDLVLDFEIDEVSGLDVAIIPFTSSDIIDPVIIKELNDNFIIQFIKDGEFRPVSINSWLDSKFEPYTFSSVDRMLNNIVYGRMPITKLCWGELSYIEGEYLFTFYWYDIQSKEKTMYQRLFNIDYSEIVIIDSEKENLSIENPLTYEEYRSEVLSNITTSIFKEFENRNEKNSYLFDKEILIKNTKISYFHYSNLSTGTEEFSDISFLQYGSTPLEDNQDFFSSLLEYSFYRTGLIKAKSDNLSFYIKKDTPMLTNYQYIVESEIKVSLNFSILKIVVRNPKWPPDDNIVIEYSFPLKDILYSTLLEAANKNTQLIILNLLSDRELKKVGIVNLVEADQWVNNKYISDENSSIEIDPIQLKENVESLVEKLSIDNLFEGKDKEEINKIKALKIIQQELSEKVGNVYVNNIYFGFRHRLGNHILPFGANDIQIDGKPFKVFISPYWMNSLYYTPTDSILMEKE